MKIYFQPYQRINFIAFEQRTHHRTPSLSWSILSTFNTHIQFMVLFKSDNILIKPFAVECYTVLKGFQARSVFIRYSSFQVENLD